MLNELRELATCLEEAGIEVEDLHQNFKLCPKYLTYWVYLDEQGNVSGIAPVPKIQVQGVRKWEKANGVSFPAFNTPPFYKAPSEEVQNQIRGIRRRIERSVAVTSEELSSAVGFCEELWDEGVIKKLADCLTKPIVDIAGYLATVPEEYQSIVQLISRTQLIKSKIFKEQLADAILQSMQTTPATELIDALFFYSGQNPKNFQVILELADKGQFKYPANHQEVQNWMNHQFLSEVTQNSRSDLDAFGCNASGKGSKFPPVGFKNALGNVILRAMNNESPCQYRYGMIDFHSFPAGEQVRKSMKSALEWLGGEERKGKTWSDLSRRMGRPMLLFAYPSAIPQDLPDLAGMMGNAEDEVTETGRAQFASLAEQVAFALRGRTQETVDCEIRVFVLAKMDKARTKVLSSGRYAAKHVIHSAQLWQDGCQNIPVIEVRSFGKNKGDKPVWSNPLIPFPAEIVWCLNTVWIRQGTYAEGAHGFTVNDALCLLLGDGVELQQVASRALGSAVRNSSPLLLAIGQAHVQGVVHKTDRNYSKQTLLLPSILGLLLLKLKHTKGEIMASPAFLVGRLLSLADSLHLEYCKHVRNNSIPPQLVGNALMASALEAPEKALAMLSQRVLPYQAWARTVKGGEEVILTKFFLKHLGEVSEQLKDTPLPQRAMDTDKAQMLLGYLARVKQD